MSAKFAGALVAAIFMFVPLQGCGWLKGAIKANAGTDARITEIDEDFFEEVIDSRNTWIIGGRPFAKMNDSLFLYTIPQGDDSLALVQCNGTLATRWRTVYAIDETESRPYIWYDGSTITLLSVAHFREYKPDHLFMVARRFNAATGARLGDTDKRLPDLRGSYSKVRCFRSPDRSTLLVQSGGYEDTDEDIKLFAARLHIFRKGSAEVVEKDIAIRLPEDHQTTFAPDFEINDRGDVFYSFYRDGYAESDEKDNAIYQSVVQLPIAGAPDTLTCSFPALSNGKHLTLAENILRMESDDVVLHAWRYRYGMSDQYTGLCAVSKMDFAQKKIVFTDTVLLSETDREALVDEDELAYYRIRDFVPLPAGEAGLVLESMDTYEGLKKTKFLRAGPLVVVKIGAKGRVQWQSSVMKDVPVGETELTSIVIQSRGSIGVFYRNRDADEGLSYTEWNLATGAAQSREIPVVVSSHCTWFSAPTLIYNNTIGVFIDDDGTQKLVTMKLDGATRPLDGDIVKRISK